MLTGFYVYLTHVKVELTIRIREGNMNSKLYEQLPSVPDKAICIVGIFTKQRQFLRYSLKSTNCTEIVYFHGKVRKVNHPWAPFYAEFLMQLSTVVTMYTVVTSRAKRTAYFY